MLVSAPSFKAFRTYNSRVSRITSSLIVLEFAHMNRKEGTPSNLERLNQGSRARSEMVEGNLRAWGRPADQPPTQVSSDPDADVNSIGGDVSPSLLSRVASSKVSSGLGILGAIFGVAAVGPKIVKEVADGNPGVHRSIDWALGSFEPAKAHADGPPIPPTPTPEPPPPPTPTPTPPPPTPTPTPTPPPPPTVTPTPPDVCPNIEGLQTSVPSGLIKDVQGNCVVPPTPTPLPETQIQVVTKKILEGNGGIAQDYIVWVDGNRNGIRDANESAQNGRTNQNGIDVKFFKDVNYGPGTRACSEEYNVSTNFDIVVGKVCDDVDGSLTAENVLINRNKLIVIVTPTPPPTPTSTPEAPRPITTPTPKVEAKPPPLPTPIPEIPKTCTLPSGQVVPLPEEFQAKLIGKDAQTIARMIAEFKCEFIGHVEQNTQEHKDIKSDTEQIIKDIGVSKDGEQVAPPLSDQIGVGFGEDSIATRVDKVAKTQTTILERLNSIKDKVSSGAHDIWDRVGTGGAAVAGATSLALVGIAWEARRRLRRRFAAIDQSFTQVQEGVSQVSTGVQARVDQLSTDVQARFDQLSTDARERDDRLEQMIAGLQPPVTPAAGGEGGSAVVPGAGTETLQAAEQAQLSDEDIDNLARVMVFFETVVATVADASDEELRVYVSIIGQEGMEFARRSQIALARLAQEEEDEELEDIEVLRRLVRRYRDLPNGIKQRVYRRLEQIRQQ